MQEFESISASSYDPSALAAKLTSKAAEGWSVVAIVPTGGDVTAFLSRERGSGAEAENNAESHDAASSQNTYEETSSSVLPATTEPEPEPRAESVSEPSGWAIAPEPAVSISPTSTYQPAATPSYEPAPSIAPAPDPAPAPSVPAGWYADPAGRFELRYWDGSTWTEHVSRAGQQFTDPPVA
jgi:hypothetical protein